MCLCVGVLLCRELAENGEFPSRAASTDWDHSEGFSGSGGELRIMSLE